jgi:hypothetical protein
VKNFLLLGVALVLLACDADENTPTQPINDDFDPIGATLVQDGMFVSAGGYTVIGTASIYEKNSSLFLVLDPYSSSNGPDLRVYLSRNEGATSFVNLGLLKSTMGKQSYAIPAGVNITEFSHVHIWCQQFSVQFGRAMLN